MEIGKIYYSEKEMIEILQKIDYIIEEIETYSIHYRSYHDDEIKYKIYIAYKEKPSNEILKKEYYIIQQICGIETIFNQEIKKRFTKMLFN